VTPEIPDYLRTSTPSGFENVGPGDYTLSGEEKLARYFNALRNMPPSGGGCHAALLSYANYGRAAGLSREQIFADLRELVHGPRIVPDREIWEAINKAFNDRTRQARPAAARVDVDGAKLLDVILKRGAGATTADLWEASPIRLNWPVERDAIEVLSHLYAPEERLFIGAQHDAAPQYIHPVSEWIARFKRDVAPAEHIIPNALSGQRGRTKDGRPSYRCDACVAQFSVAVIEFDNLPRQQQIEFWAGQPMPVVALIDSGGKSVHGWVLIGAASAEEWTERVENKLFAYLKPMGVDSTCRNESRLSRMPGHFRIEKRKWQRLLYLNPDGGTVQP
jgi:hypothetical protein